MHGGDHGRARTLFGEALEAGRELGDLAIADGSALLFVGLPGLAAWLVWLVVTGLRLIRGQG